jgi:hypothetical protein
MSKTGLVNKVKTYHRKALLNFIPYRTDGSCSAPTPQLAQAAKVFMPISFFLVILRKS